MESDLDPDPSYSKGSTALPLNHVTYSHGSLEHDVHVWRKIGNLTRIVQLFQAVDLFSSTADRTCLTSLAHNV